MNDEELNRKKIQKKKNTPLEDRTDYEQLLADQCWLTESSLKILNDLPMDKIIDHILSYLLNRTDSDRAYMIRINWDQHIMCCTNELLRPGATSEKRNFEFVDIMGMDYILQRLHQDHIYHISSLDSIPPESWEIREILAGRGVDSLILAPVMINNRLDSYIGVDWIGVTHLCRVTEKQLIRSAAYLISLALERDSEMKQILLEKKQAQESDRIKSDFLTKISREIENPPKLLKMLDSIGSIVKVETNHDEHSLEKVPILPFLDDIHKFHEKHTSHEVNLITRIHCPADFFLITDRGLLEKILNHIMIYTLKTVREGEIRIICKLDPVQQLIAFRISAPTDAAMSPFEEPVWEMTLCRSLAGRLGGHLSLYHEREQGTIFELILPLSQARVSA